MKNKLFAAAAIVLAFTLLHSCSTQRSAGAHKKGYGCPNSTGLKTETRFRSLPA